jgi:hypothetical protein
MKRFRNDNIQGFTEMELNRLNAIPKNIFEEYPHWNEIVKIENQGNLSEQELLDEVKRVQLKILYALEDYAQKNKEI